MSFQDLSGKVFGWLTVVRFRYRGPTGSSHWLCQCRCGRHKVVRVQLLTSGNTRSCGCLRHRGYFKDRTGDRVGFLTVLEFAGRRGAVYYWKCQCDCGNEITTTLRGSKWQSCGCTLGRWKKKLNPRGTQAYHAWNGLKARCLNPKVKDYHRYGARGIQLCERWMDFDNFYADMGDPPSPDHSIERLDNNGNYELDNCVWALPIQQARNRRNTPIIQYRGEPRLLVDICNELGISYKRSRARLAAGMNLKSVLKPGKLNRWEYEQYYT